MDCTNRKAEPDAQTILRNAAEQVEQILRRVVSDEPMPPRLAEAMQYSLLAGGKRLRPALVLESARACSMSGQLPPAALNAAAAIELIHTFSLVHDDLPAMDDDDLRRGKPTTHKVFGEALAILAGDAMVSLAFELLTRDTDAETAQSLVRELARASGGRGMIGGQVLDIENEHKSLSLNDLRNIHRMKTAALLRAACRMGGICAAASEAQLQSLTVFGDNIGLAFQIVDDLLDVTSTAEQLGKATRKDHKKGKNTYPALMGIEEARRCARQGISDAIETLTPLGESARNLRTLAEFVVARGA